VLSVRRRLAGSVPYHLGYGLTHPIALEGALKLKEITYAHCEGIFSSEFKHGPLRPAAVHDGYPVIFITAPGDEATPKADQPRQRSHHPWRPGCSNRIALAAEDPALRANVHDYLVIPEADRFLSPILLTLPAQLISYHMSAARGIDPDLPRNLSKTLTVD